MLNALQAASLYATSDDIVAWDRLAEAGEPAPYMPPALGRKFADVLNRRAVEALQARQAELRAAAKARFLAAGGCASCGGTGRVVTWSTLDGPSYTEYGSCESCDGSGPYDWSMIAGPYTYGRGVVTGRFILGEICATQEEVEEIEALEEARKVASMALEEADAWAEIETGAIVVVSRKYHEVSKGEVGLVFWAQDQARTYYGRTTYTRKLGCRRPNGSVFWITSGCVTPVARAWRAGLGEQVKIVQGKPVQPVKSDYVVPEEPLRITRSTEKAVLAGGQWFPRSQVEIEDEHVVQVSSWIARQKGIAA